MPLLPSICNLNTPRVGPNHLREVSTIITVKNYHHSDLERLWSLANAIHGEKGWWAARSPDNLSVWLGQPTIDPERDVFLALEDESPIGYLIANLEPPLKRVVLEGAVHPDHRRRGAGAQLVEASSDRASGLDYKIIQMAVPYAHINARRLAKRCGFRFIRKFWEMKLDNPASVPDPDLYQGFHLRHFREGDEDRLRFIQNLSFARHWGYSPNRLEDIHYKVRMGLFTFDDILLVLDGDVTIGFNWTRLERRQRGTQGWIGMMGAHPDYRGKGLGTSIMRAGVRYLRNSGASRIDLTVDSLNPSAHRIYRAGGFSRQAVTVWYERAL